MPQLVSRFATRRTPTTIYTVGSANYVGMYGIGEVGEAPGRGNGTFFRNSRIGVQDIRDGSSQTFAVGERSHDLSYVTWTGRAVGGWLFPTSSFEGGRNKFNPEPEESFTMVLGPVGLEDLPRTPNYPAAPRRGLLELARRRRQLPVRRRFGPVRQGQHQPATSTGPGHPAGARGRLRRPVLTAADLGDG